MNTIKHQHFSEIYKQLLTEAYHYPDYISSPRGLMIRELTNVELHLEDPYSNSFKNSFRSPKPDYLYPELLWYFSDRNDLEFISHYSKFWNRIANEDGTVNSAYGNLLFTEKNEYGLTEYQWALESLKKDKDSRQAIIRFNKPKHSYIGNKDFVCTLNGTFHIRKNKNGVEYLNLTTTMRSQDVWFGIIYDIPFYTLLQQQMHKHLRKYYPNLLIGDFRHYVLSEHIYEKDFDAVEQMLDREFQPDSVAINYSTDLINEDGSPSKELNLAMDAVLHKNEYVEFEDPLINKMIEYSLRD